MSLLLTTLVVCLISLLSSCASSQKVDEILEEVKEQQTLSQEVANPAYLQLEQLLKSKGYEPIGMQYEDTATLDLLTQVFHDPKTDNRAIKLVYTGLQMAYDKNAESLTIGGLTNKEAIVQYIVKKIASKPKSIETPKMTLPGFPMPSPSSTPAPVPSPSAEPPLMEDPSGF